MLSNKYRFVFFLMAALMGAVIGFFVLYPINEFVYYHEHEKYEPDAVTAMRFVGDQMLESLRGEALQKTTFYALIGAVLGLIMGYFYDIMHSRWLQIQQLSEELEKDLSALINQGEGPLLEFKSSLRWDIEQERVNKALEGVVMKTIAGFMNHEGGTLLLGVADDGTVVGLEKDYQSLKKPGRDGYEQFLMGAIATNLGADSCQWVKIVFHQCERHDLCRLIVHPASRPIYIQQGNTPKLYLRTGGGTRDLNVQEAMEFMSGRWSKKNYFF